MVAHILVPYLSHTVPYLSYLYLSDAAAHRRDAPASTWQGNTNGQSSGRAISRAASQAAEVKGEGGGNRREEGKEDSGQGAEEAGGAALRLSGQR